MPSTHSGTEALLTASRSRMSQASERSSDLPSSLTDRVLARVRDAETAVERSNLRHGAPSGQTPEQVRRARSLRRVFVDLGTSYREFRRRTGADVSPVVRDAACRFRRELDVTSLVAVAASLDQLEALPW